MRCYIGDLDDQMAAHLIPMLERGLCRLEGFALRLQPTAVGTSCNFPTLAQS